MTQTRSGYDQDLQMYVEQPHDADLPHLRFARWLLEHGHLEHGVVGPSSGDLAEQPPTPAIDGVTS